MLIMIANVGSHYLTSFSIVLCGHVVLTFYVLCTYLKHSHSVLIQLCDVSTLRPVTKLLLLYWMFAAILTASQQKPT